MSLKSLNRQIAPWTRPLPSRMGETVTPRCDVAVPAPCSLRARRTIGFAVERHSSIASASGGAPESTSRTWPVQSASGSESSLRPAGLSVRT